MDFAKSVKAIALPQDVPSTSNHRLIKLENQVQCLMEAHLAPTQPTQVNKVTTSCEICSGPHDTRYCMKDLEQAFVEYASSRNQDMGNMKFTTNQGLRNFNEATNTWKDKPNFNWERTQTFTSPQNGSISTHYEESEAEEGETTTDITPEHGHNITKETKDEVNVVIDEEESKVETDEEIEEILEEEEEDEDGE
ncbi:hypothetical protein Tco_1316590, partial [Tanacetum coccineum]